MEDRRFLLTFKKRSVSIQKEVTIASDIPDDSTEFINAVLKGFDLIWVYNFLEKDISKNRPTIYFEAVNLPYCRGSRCSSYVEYEGGDGTYLLELIHEVLQVTAQVIKFEYELSTKDK